MPTVNDLCVAMESIAPLNGASDWDNVGLLLGRRSAASSRVLICLDLTTAVLTEATSRDIDAIVSYHPILFEGAKRLTSDQVGGEIVLRLAESGIAVYSPHTALDAAPGGMAEWLSTGMGDGQVRPIEPQCDLSESERQMIITYAPRSAADSIREAMSSAGAGNIGAYDQCSTLIESVGTFRGGEDTNPTVGNAGTLERVDESRLMMVCASRDLADVIAALHTAHPYERPPVHVIKLQSHPSQTSGGGRIMQFDSPQQTQNIAARLKNYLGVETLRYTRGQGGCDEHTIAACCPGAGGSMLDAARRAGATLFITGEMRHHDLQEAAAHGVDVLLAGHANTEAGYLPVLCETLAAKMPGTDIRVSEAEPSPWELL
ncbi:MAG: Nif3-like dinuclear metal center hexameric protein [Planctomycetes bacterium]|jgi:dinuclear metal center YbgI/SA1388 family protein|nr:Nif3-like dinuclear metal center hexameric protein [Planctomycetota bacterium]